MLDKHGIARRIAQEVPDNSYVNLGIGIPTLVANYLPAGLRVVLQSENGLLGMGPFPTEAAVDPVHLLLDVQRLPDAHVAEARLGQRAPQCAAAEARMTGETRVVVLPLLGHHQA